jgi:hypothetical protein
MRRSALNGFDAGRITVANAATLVPHQATYSTKLINRPDRQSIRGQSLDPGPLSDGQGLTVPSITKGASFSRTPRLDSGLRRLPDWLGANPANILERAGR